MQRLVDGQTKLREELWNDVDRVRNELRMVTASRKEDRLGSCLQMEGIIQTISEYFRRTGMDKERG